ncbi:MAG TPA: sugar ABC transporter permease [Candidatus Angelobacter sp.]|nr:sugar ABC transporter permease [Candidatus Angelobacter sp.]
MRKNSVQRVPPAAAQPSGRTRKISLSYDQIQPYTLVLALAVVWLVAGYLTGGVFLESRNFSNLMRQMAVTGVLSIGMLMVIVSANIDLSVGSLVGLAGMTAAIVQASAGHGLIASLLSAILLGLLVGAFQGALVAYVQIPSFIVTLGGLLAWRGVTKGISSGETIPLRLARFQAIGQEYLPVPMGTVLAALAIATIAAVVLWRSRARKRLALTPWNWWQILAQIAVPSILVAVVTFGLNSYAGIPVPVLIFLTIALLGAFLMRNTVFGRYLYAIGGNADAARLSGINLRWQVLIVFCLMGALSGVAGILYTSRVGSASTDAGLLLELDAIAACVIGGASLMGGRGTVVGACLGALLMASLDNGMSLRNVPDFMQDIVKGGILVAAVAVDMVSRRRY